MSLFKIVGPIIYILMNVVNILDDGQHKVLTVLAQILWISQSLAALPKITNHTELIVNYVGLILSFVGIPLTLLF